MIYLYIYLFIGLLACLHNTRQLRAVFSLNAYPQWAFKYFVIIAVIARVILWPLYFWGQSKPGRNFRIKWQLKFYMRMLKKFPGEYGQPAKTTEDGARPE